MQTRFSSFQRRKLCLRRRHCFNKRAAGRPQNC